jgi:hypothetical protein
MQALSAMLADVLEKATTAGATQSLQLVANAEPSKQREQCLKASFLELTGFEGAPAKSMMPHKEVQELLDAAVANTCGWEFDGYIGLHAYVAEIVSDFRSTDSAYAEIKVRVFTPSTKMPWVRVTRVKEMELVMKLAAVRLVLRDGNEDRKAIAGIVARRTYKSFERLSHEGESDTKALDAVQEETTATQTAAARFDAATQASAPVAVPHNNMYNNNNNNWQGNYTPNNFGRGFRNQNNPNRGGFGNPPPYRSNEPFGAAPRGGGGRGSGRGGGRGGDRGRGGRGGRGGFAAGRGAGSGSAF